MEALQRVLGRHLRMLRDQRLVRDVEDAELVLEPLRVAKAQALAVALCLDALVGEPRCPEVERRGRAHPPDDPVDHALARASERGARVLEEGEVETRLRVLVAVEEVVDSRVVLVHGLLDHPQPEHARVEVDIRLSVPRDRRDVVDAVQPHVRSLANFLEVIARATISRRARRVASAKPSALSVTIAAPPAITARAPKISAAGPATNSPAPAAVVLAVMKASIVLARSGSWARQRHERVGGRVGDRVGEPGERHPRRKQQRVAAGRPRARAVQPARRAPT